MISIYSKETHTYGHKFSLFSPLRFRVIDSGGAKSFVTVRSGIIPDSSNQERKHGRSFSLFTFPIPASLHGKEKEEPWIGIPIMGNKTRETSKEDIRSFLQQVPVGL